MPRPPRVSGEQSGTTSTTPSTTTSGNGPTSTLATAARAAAHQARDLDPAGFDRRHADWPRWAARAATARTIATTLGVPAAVVRVGDDPSRPDPRPGPPRRPDRDRRPGARWRAIPDPHTGPAAWLLLDECPQCYAPAVPVTRIATLADLGAWLDPDPDFDALADFPPAFRSDPGHAPAARTARHPTARPAPTTHCPDNNDPDNEATMTTPIPRPPTRAPSPHPTPQSIGRAWNWAAAC